MFKQKKYWVIPVLVVAMLAILSSCKHLAAKWLESEPYIVYHQMEDFTDEQAVQIKEAFDLPLDIDIALISLTKDSAWRDSSVMLVFSIEQESWELFNDNLPSELTFYATEKEVIINDKSYCKSREATGGIHDTFAEYSSIDDTDEILYTYRKFRFNDGVHIREMVREFGQEVDGFPKFED